jgi:DNA modification methylase
MLNAPEKIAALRIDRMELAALKPHPRNPRKHPKPESPAWDALKKSLAHDYFDPLVVNERNGMLVSGHLRHKVLLASGFTHADVSVVSYDEPTHVARLIAANSLLGDWEDELLTSLAGELTRGGIDAGLANLTEKDLASYLDGPSVTDDTGDATVLVSQAEEVARKWQVAPGDLYAIGEHRVFCGDCTREESWQLLLGDRLADMVWTDPPYNVDYDSIQQRRVDLKRAEGKNPHAKPEAIINDDLTEAEYEKFLRTCFAVAHSRLKPGGAIYVAHADSYGRLTRQLFTEAGFYEAQCLIWVKNAFTLGRQDYQWQHEPILYGWKSGAGHYWQGGFSQASVIDDEQKQLDKLTKGELVAIIQTLRNARDTSVIREPRGTGNALHPTVKPLPLVARQIWNSSHRGDTVLELFGGSGTTILAAEQTNRRAVATELDPKFCAVILERCARAGLTVEKIRDGSASA